MPPRRWVAFLRVRTLVYLATLGYSLLMAIKSSPLQAVGALVCKNAKDLQKAKFLATAAKDDALHYQHTDYGYNYRLSNVLAAIGVGQMEVLEKRVEQRRAIFDDYQEHLQKLSIGVDIHFMNEIKGARGNRCLRR